MLIELLLKYAVRLWYWSVVYLITIHEIIHLSINLQTTYEINITVQVLLRVIVSLLI